MTIKAGDNVTITKDGDTNTAVINAVDTTYSVTSEAGEEGTNIVNNYTMTGTNGDEYTFTDTDTKYELSGEKGEKAADGSTTYTVTLKDQAGNDAGTAVIVDTDTHNGLKNDENKVEYNDKGEGSVTITDQDGNTTTINNIVNTTYTATQEVTAGENPGEGSTTFNITDNNGNDAGSMTIKAGDNVTITKDGDTNTAVINAVDTTYSVTSEAGEEGTNIVNNYTMTGTNGDEYTFTDTDTKYELSGEKGEKAADGSTTYTVTLKDQAGNDAGTAVIVDTDTHNGLKNDENKVEYNDKGEGSVTITDQDGNTTTINNIQNTTYKITEEAGDAGTNIVNNYTMTGTNGDEYKFVDTDTTYTIEEAAGEEGSNVVNNYTMTGTNGDKYTFKDTDTDTTYTVDTKREKQGTVAATTTITDSNGKEVGKFDDTHNGLKNDTNAVEYNDNGEGSVTITDQDGNTTTITGIRYGGEGNVDAINRLGDRINHLDKRINKVGAGAAALAALHPLDFDPDEKWDFSAGAGSYKGEHAVALGAFYRPNEDTMFSIGGTIGNGDNMINVGVSWKFGQKNRISANRISSAKEIIELRKNQENVHSFLADAVAGNQLDLSKIQLFPDVEENHWAYDYVATMAGNGVLEGYPDGYFKGNRNMTRYEMAAVLYRLMQNGARLSDRALTEFAPELDRIRVDTITQHKDGTPHIQRVRTIKERVDEKADPSSEKAAKKKAKIKVAEKPME